MEIKVGDKVRVREDAPRKTRLGEVIPTKRDFTVTGIGKNYAEIKLIGSLLPTYYPIPLKYLVKVEEEKKEAKFKVGQFAMFKGRRVEIIGYSEHYPQMYRVFVLTENYHTDAKESDLEPYAEPTEQTEAEKKPNVGSIKIPVEVDLTDSFWDAYTADLAKEIAIVYAKQKRDVRLAVRDAKAVVEELKKK